MRSRKPRSLFGRPALFRDFQRQNALKPRTMPAKNGLRLNHLRGTERARPKLGHTDQLFSERTGPRQAGDLRRSAPTALKPAVFLGPRKLRCLHRATLIFPSLIPKHYYLAPDRLVRSILRSSRFFYVHNCRGRDTALAFKARDGNLGAELLGRSHTYKENHPRIENDREMRQ
jgi:hypothetical protein